MQVRITLYMSRVWAAAQILVAAGLSVPLLNFLARPLLTSPPPASVSLSSGGILPTCGWPAAGMEGRVFVEQAPLCSLRPVRLYLRLHTRFHAKNTRLTPLCLVPAHVHLLVACNDKLLTTLLEQRDSFVRVEGMTCITF